MIDINIGTGQIAGKSKAILNSPIELVVQQIDMLFGTDTADVLGDMTYGSNYDKYLYTTGMSNASLESKIMSDISSLDLLGFKPSVKVTLLEGTVRDIALIDITLSGDYETINKIYRIE